MIMRDIVLIAHNLRSTHNIGSLMRTAEGLGVNHFYISGYSPYPEIPGRDIRLPHLRAKISRQIHKTALGAENSLNWSYETNLDGLIKQLKLNGYTIIALEQTADAKNITNYQPPLKVALLVGSEVEGLDATTLASSDLRLHIPMLGAKESFNAAVAAAIGLYHLRFSDTKLDK